MEDPSPAPDELGGVARPESRAHAGLRRATFLALRFRRMASGETSTRFR